MIKMEMVVSNKPMSNTNNNESDDDIIPLIIMILIPTMTIILNPLDLFI